MLNETFTQDMKAIANLNRDAAIMAFARNWEALQGWDENTYPITEWDMTCMDQASAYLRKLANF